MTGEPRPPRELRVVVDTMLQGLGRQLRCCGVDVAMIDPFADHSKAVEVNMQFHNAMLKNFELLD